MLDPTIYKDWQIAEEAEKTLPTTEEFRIKMGLLPDEMIPYGRTPKLDFIKIMNRLRCIKQYDQARSLPGRGEILWLVRLEGHVLGHRPI